MDALRAFFTANEFILLSIQGQVFFVLGLGIAMQLWRDSRLDIAQHLSWLSAFGFLHALYTWGGVFIPIQATYLAAPFVEALVIGQVLLLGASLACLYQFGIRTIATEASPRWLHFIVPTTLALWITWAMGPALFNAPSAETWHRDTALWARYLLGAPGALVAAIGLRSQAGRLIAPLRLPHIWRTLRIAGLALAGLSVAMGLVVPSAQFLPASVLNEEALFAWTAVPASVYRAVFGVILAAAMVRAMDVFRTEVDRHVARLQESEALAAERERFGRELHDGTLQVIYASGLLLRTTERRCSDRLDPEDHDRLQSAIGLLDRAVEEVRQHLGHLGGERPSGDLIAELDKLVKEPYLRALVDLSMELQVDSLPDLGSTCVGHVVAVTREALSNAVRHGHAQRVVIRVTQADGRLGLTVLDDGSGLPQNPQPGSGLGNMRDRARLLNGTITVSANKGRGTAVVLDLPIPQE